MSKDIRIGKIHTNNEILVKIRALLYECKSIYDINKSRRVETRGELTRDDFLIDSMNQLADELDRELINEGDK